MKNELKWSRRFDIELMVISLDIGVLLMIT